MRVCCRVAHVRLSAGLWARRASDGGCRARRPCARFCQEASDPQSASRFQASAGRRGDRRRRYLHAPRVACGDDRRGHASGKARHLREAVHRIFRTRRRQDSDRQARAEIAHVRARHGRDGQDLRGHKIQRPAFHVRGRLGLRAGGGENRRDIEGHQGQDLVHEGRGEPQRIARGPCRPVVDDRRRLAHPHGVSSAVDGALSETGGGACTRRADRGIGRDRRRRQRRGLPAPPRAPLHHADPIDVEDWGMLTLTFSDGTKSTVFSGDMIMGGVRNVIETYTSGGTLFANITPNNHMTSYLTDEEKLAGVYITEKVDRKTGWQFICLEEEWTRGYLQEIQDFMECVAVGRQPRADLGLAYETTKINYAGYWSAEEGRRIAL